MIKINTLILMLAMLLSLPVAAQSTDKRMDFAFQDVPVRALLQVLSETAGVNLVADEAVVGTITLNLKQATWQDALAVIVRAKRLNVEQQGQTYYISGAANNEAVEVSDPRVDMSAQQVLIEARIVEASDSFSRNLGVKLGFNDLTQMGSRTIPDPSDASKTIQVPLYSAPTKSGALLGSSIANVQNQSGQGTSVTNSMVNLPALSSLANPATFAVSLFRSGVSQFINLEISALETDGKGKLISSPRVVTSDKVKAIIEQGTEIPYQNTTNLGATSTSFRKANLKLEVTPHITPNGDVLMDVDVTKDSVGTLLTSAGYTINTKHVQTKVKVENGGTLVIGGIYQEESHNSENKVPLLGDIPVLGYLFKTKNKTINKTELLIFLTPHLLDAKGLPIASPKNNP